MKVDFKGISVPPDPSTFPLPKQEVLEGKELEETRERMREWLRKYDEHSDGVSE